MSRTYDLVCTKCKKALWIGQAGGGAERGHIYTGDQKVMRDLNAFLWDHMDHPLVFCNDEGLDDDIEEVS